MKIAFLLQPISRLALPIRGDSLSLWSYEVGRRIAPRHEVRLYAPGGERGARREQAEGLEIVRLPRRPDAWLARIATRPSGESTRPAFAAPRAHAVYATLAALSARAWGADAVHVHNYTQFLPILRRLTRARLLLNMQCEWASQLDAGWMERRLACADRVIGCSEFIAERIRRRFPGLAERVVSVPNGVDVERFAPAEPAPGDDPAVILFVGRISPEKGVHVLLEAFERVLAVHPEARLRLVGPERAAPREFILDLDPDPVLRAHAPEGWAGYPEAIRRGLPPRVAARVEFLGSRTPGEVAAEYRRASVFTFPSLWNEPFGMPNVEAMACGVPTVSTRSGGIPEVVIDGETGLLAERGDATSLAEALLRMLDDREAAGRMARAGRQRAIERFRWELVADAILRLASPGTDGARARG